MKRVLYACCFFIAVGMAVLLCLATARASFIVIDPGDISEKGSGCTSPTGSMGDIIYNTGYNVMQYCDSTYWRAMGSWPGTGGSGGCTSPVGSRGDMMYNSASAVMQYCDGTYWRAMGPVPGTSGGGGCSNPSGSAGDLMFNSDSFVMQYCDSTYWRQTRGSYIINTTQLVDAFAFTDQTGIALSTTVTSDTVVLSGGFTNQTATCNAGCTAISINGAAFTAGPVAGVNSGDTIAIKQVSSSEEATTTFTTVNVGVIPSANWSVTTIGVDAFAFAIQWDVPLSSTITSDTVVLSGGFSNKTATCGTGCTAISINGAAFTAGPVTGVNSGDTIAIRQTSSASYSTPTSASVTVGNTTSSNWYVITICDPGLSAMACLALKGGMMGGLSP